LRPRLNALNEEAEAFEEFQKTGGSITSQKHSQAGRSLTAAGTNVALGGSTVTSPSAGVMKVPIAGYTGHRMGYKS